MAYSKIDLRGYPDAGCPFFLHDSVVCINHDIDLDDSPEPIQFVCVCDSCVVVAL